MKMLGQRIRELREKRSIFQDELAKAVGVSKNSIYNYENGKRQPDADVIIALANYFGVSTDYLLGKSDLPNDIAQIEENVLISNLLGIISGIETPIRGYLLLAFEKIAKGYKRNEDDEAFLSKYAECFEVIGNSLSNLAGVNYTLHNKRPWPTHPNGDTLEESDFITLVDGCSSNIKDTCEKLTEVVEDKYTDIMKEIISGRKRVFLDLMDFL